MHSKRTFRLVVFAARAPIGTTGGLLLFILIGVRKCDTRSYDMNCPFLQLGFPCVHPNQTHEMISEAFRQPDVFDPLKLQPANRTVALAVMVGVVLLQSPLYQPATSKIQSTAAQPGSAPLPNQRPCQVAFLLYLLLLNGKKICPSN